MTIKQKIQSLLTAANTKTGESDSTLTDAVQTLIDGYGQGGGGAIASANILNGVGLNAGYLNSTGVPQSQDGTKLEVYTDEIDASDYEGQTLNLYIFTQTVGTQWLGCCFFDASHAFIGPRQNIQPSPNMKGAVFNIVVPSGAKYVRFSWRTYGNARYAASVGDAVYNAVGEDGFCVYPE